MMNISEIIVYIWLIPVVIQIILPLGMFLSWLVFKPFAEILKQQRVAVPTASLQES